MCAFSHVRTVADTKKKLMCLVASMKTTWEMHDMVFLLTICMLLFFTHLVIQNDTYARKSG